MEVLTIHLVVVAVVFLGRQTRAQARPEDRPPGSWQHGVHNITGKVRGRVAWWGRGILWWSEIFSTLVE